jgi:RNA polymerase sigma-70 factor (ECF subfamily)
VEAARGGDRDAFAVLVHQASDRLFALAYRILRDPHAAEDVLQDALITIWRELPGLRESDRFEAWVHRILIHTCYAQSRRDKRRMSVIRPLAADDPEAPDDAQTVIDRDELERIFRRLPVDQRAVFVLHHYTGLPLVEVADTLGIPAGTARSRLHYATRALRASMRIEAIPAAHEGRAI